MASKHFALRKLAENIIDVAELECLKTALANGSYEASGKANAKLQLQQKEPAVPLAGRKYFPPVFSEMIQP